LYQHALQRRIDYPQGANNRIVGPVWLRFRFGRMHMRYILDCVVAISIMCLSTGCASMGQKGALSLAYKAMQKGKYDHALNKLSQAEHYTPPSPSMAAEISFLQAQCYDRSGRVSEAVGAYSYTAENFAGTGYARQAQERLSALKPSAEP
jgi:hypothetical protein